MMHLRGIVNRKLYLLQSLSLSSKILVLYVNTVTAHVSQAIAPVTPAPPACQNSATGEIIQ